MRKSLFILLLSLLVTIPTALFSAGSDPNCNTRYPVILAHGMGAQAKIVNVVDYWWGIEDALEDEGADVYVTSVNGMDSTANKAASFKRQFLNILAITGKTKANIIGHSHGTIYTRYAISNLALSGKVASYTSLSGPHRGSSVADLMFKMVPNQGWSIVGGALDIVYTFVFGDKNPNSLANGLEVTRSYMNNTFNPNCPNKSGIYYQSITSKIKYVSNSLVLQVPWLICKAYEGDNDGLVSVNSAKWGTFRGVVEGAAWAGGVDHLNIVNQFFGITPGFDAPQFYIDIVADLKNKGY
ncbi:MAG: alpha/beta hydrolase [Spirochaetae bacterium HGW-Spirochaetae-5]|nr:MAG: alpha/beta hydrolase [Spirochaetae bacterium HGW-Spirochaetae-5]